VFDEVHDWFTGPNGDGRTCHGRVFPALIDRQRLKEFQDTQSLVMALQIHKRFCYKRILLIFPSLAKCFVLATIFLEMI